MDLGSKRGIEGESCEEGERACEEEKEENFGDTGCEEEGFDNLGERGCEVGKEDFGDTGCEEGKFDGLDEERDGDNELGDLVNFGGVGDNKVGEDNEEGVLPIGEVGEFVLEKAK